MQNYKIIRDLLVNKARDLKELALILEESKYSLRKLRYPERRNNLLKIAIAMFVLPEPIITEILGVLLLLLSFKGFKRIDERVLEEMLILKYKMKITF